MIRITKEDLLKCPVRNNGTRSYKYPILFKEHAVKHTEESFPDIGETFDRMRERAEKGKDEEANSLLERLYTKKVREELRGVFKAVMSVPGVKAERENILEFGFEQNPKELTETPMISLRINFSMS